MLRELVLAGFIMSIGICVAELGLGDSMLASLEASGMHLGLETGDVATFVMIAGPKASRMRARSVGPSKFCCGDWLNIPLGMVAY